MDAISNPSKLRRLSERVGAPVIAAYARWFEPQTTILVFTDAKTAWVVPREGSVERYERDVEWIPGRGVRVR
jgi:hypothetical protein